MAEKINLTVNGKKRTVEVEGWEKLLDVLRDKLGLIGSKRGCDDATCGACTVVVNGEAVKSCILTIPKFKDADVVTIEAMSDGDTLHPIQKALIEAGAVQCGYCMPGIVMHLYALYTKNVDASDDEIKEALSHHLCRCTGYEAIWDGAKLAQKYMKNG